MLILKLGGAVITYKNSETPKINKDTLTRLAQEIEQYYIKNPEPLIIIHGAGSYGHPIVIKTKINEGIKSKQQLLDFAETQRLQNELNCIVTKELIKKSLPAFPCQASSHAIMNKKKFVSMNIKTVEGLLNTGMIPVLFGVPAYDKSQGCSILSGDDIAVYLAENLSDNFQPLKIIFATNVDGVMTSDPHGSKSNAKLIRLIDKTNIAQVTEMLTSEDTKSDVTGKMMGKVLKVTGVVRHNVSSQIFNATVPNNLYNVLVGKQLGTIIQ